MKNEDVVKGKATLFNVRRKRFTPNVSLRVANVYRFFFMRPIRATAVDDVGNNIVVMYQMRCLLYIHMYTGVGKWILIISGNLKLLSGKNTDGKQECCKFNMLWHLTISS